MKPFQSRKQVRIEIFNELVIVFMCYHMFCFTDLTDLNAQIEPIMYSFLASVAIIVICNIGFMVDDVYRPIRLWWLKRKAAKGQQISKNEETKDNNLEELKNQVLRRQ